jgi:PAS domain S-box-containing protein
VKEIWKATAFVAFLLALLVLLLWRSSSPELELRSTMQSRLRELELRDAELTRDALRARAGLLPNYDALARDREQLLAALDGLRTVAAGSAAAVVGPALERLSRSLDGQLERLEDFKSEDALLRNSVTFLTYNIVQGAAGKDVAALSSPFLRFIQSPNGATAEEFSAALERLAGRGAVGEADALHVLLAHGRLVVAGLPGVVALLQDIASAPVTQDLGGVQSQVDLFADQAEARAQLARYLLFGVALVLLAYLMRQFARVRAYGRDLRSSNAQLSREVGERKQAEAALRESEQRYRAIAQSAHDAIITTDSRGAIASWNPAATACFGYADDEVLGTPVQRLMPERLRETAAALTPLPTDDGNVPSPALASTGLRKDGSEFPFEASIGIWATAQGRFVTAILRDVGLRKQLEEKARRQELQLVQANKLGALGTLVSGVAHEINNPNQLVLFNAGLLADIWRDACAVLDAHQAQGGDLTLAGLPYAEMRDNTFTLIHDVKEGALRIDRIVQDLKDFARPQRGVLGGTVDVNDVVQRAVRLLGHTIHKRCSNFRPELATEPLAVRGDAQQLEQVVVNLLVNALEALPDASRAVTVATGRNAEGGVVIELRDEGVGIPVEHLQRLCDPFFTTKLDSGGTGLGLSVTFSLVQAHGGRLDFESEPGRGTRATVTLPPAPAPAPAALP